MNALNALPHFQLLDDLRLQPVVLFDFFLYRCVVLLVLLLDFEVSVGEG